MKTKHTQGEWVAYQPKNASGFQINCNEETIAVVLLQGQDGKIIEETSVNAKLIAAAPLLLDALDDVIDIIGGLIDITPSGKRDELFDLYSKVILAIEKAT